ncbi:MAG: stress responsive protein [Pseudomonadales bacterium]|nr:stress responsive protein [Pseudomonadales bacterium]HAG94347.1 stress responsive protein [Gammaproteobacteria bacterium]MAQ24874.1 stress responsive protein [Pseudomonadales bacterium]MAQ26803.1 stress responsive protein [Pseudomonadales bacterium]HAU16064.1 stress responsive protein [Gammaproteobacteria bacterium]|tara:strand:+ start:1103 stop:1576 length:474 start_codon:yes stop_codon:yes gene_type:complete
MRGGSMKRMGLVGGACWWLVMVTALYSFVQVAAADNHSNNNARNVPLHHIVLVRFTESSTKAQRQRIIEDSLNLLRTIPGVIAVAAGAKARADRAVHLSQYDVGIYVQLRNVQALDAYSAHPQHQQLLKNNQEAIAAINVIDFSGRFETAAAAQQHP